MSIETMRRDDDEPVTVSLDDETAAALDVLIAGLDLSALDLLGRAVEPDQTVRRPVQGDMWGDDRAPRLRREHPGQAIIPGCAAATVCATVD